MPKRFNHHIFKRRKGETGFTLLELLISLSIMSIILVLVLGALRIGFRAWEKGDRMVNDQREYRVALDRIKAQLSSTVVNLASLSGKTGQKSPVVFNGSEDSLSFVSSLPLTPQNGRGKVFVKYLVGGSNGRRQILIFETPLALAPNPDEWPDPPAERFSLVLENAAEITFEYLNPGPGKRCS